MTYGQVFFLTSLIVSTNFLAHDKVILGGVWLWVGIIIAILEFRK